MKKILAVTCMFSILISFAGCGGDGSGQQNQQADQTAQEPQWTQKQFNAYLNRESDDVMAYAGPFYFGNFEGFDANSANYSKMRNDKVDEIIAVLDSGIDVLTKLDLKLKEQKEIYAWYVGEINKIDESSKGFTDKLLRATNINNLSGSLSNLLVLKKKADAMEKDAVWGFIQFQKYGDLVELTDMYTYEVRSQLNGITALYFMLEADANTAYQDLNKQFTAKIDPVSNEASDLFNELYYDNAVVKYGEDMLFTGDYYFAKDTVKSLDVQIANAKKTIADYTGTNELLSENMLALLKTKLQDFENYRNNIVAYLDSIPNTELKVADPDKSAPVTFIPVAYAQMDLPGYFQQKVTDGIKLVKSVKGISVAVVKIAGEKVKDLYDKSGAHEVIKDGAQIVNGGIEIVDSTVETTIYGAQGLYFGDMTWKDFKNKIEREKQELHDKFVNGTLGKQQFDEMIKQLDQFKHNTDTFVKNMAGFSGFVTDVVTKSPQAGNFVKDVIQNVGTEAKKALDTSTDFAKNIAIIMHPETSKEDTRKALLDLYAGLKETKDKEGKLVDIEAPDIKDLIKTETIKKLGLGESEEKEFLDTLKDVFKDELKQPETPDSKKTPVKTKSDEKTIAAVSTILTTPGLTDEQIADLILAEITKGLPPLKDGGAKKEPEKENKDKDNDGIEDKYDNCENVSNPDQTDTDMDSLGDECDPDCSGDIDTDAVCNEKDNCPKDANGDQIDTDNDGKGDICDFDAPLLSEIAGSWPGSVTINDVIISDELRAEAAKDEGCDLSEIEALKGQTKPITVSISATSETEGFLIMSGGDMGDGQQIPFTYNNGVLNAAISQEGASMNFNMNFTGNKSTGSMNVDYLNGGAKINGSMNLTK